MVRPARRNNEHNNVVLVALAHPCPELRDDSLDGCFMRLDEQLVEDFLDPRMVIGARAGRGVRQAGKRQEGNPEPVHLNHRTRVNTP